MIPQSHTSVVVDRFFSFKKNFFLLEIYMINLDPNTNNVAKCEKPHLGYE